MENIKTSTSRDFRINVNIVQETLQVSSDDDNGQDEEEESSAGDAPEENEQVSCYSDTGVLLWFSGWLIMNGIFLFGFFVFFCFFFVRFWVGFSCLFWGLFLFVF